MPLFFPAQPSRQRRDSGHANAHVVLFLLVGVSLWLVRPAWSQVDTTQTGKTDSTRQTPVDSLRPPQAGTSGSSEQGPVRPLPFVSSPYGRPTTDSIPGRLPHVSVVGILGERPGSFLYDLGPTGWPHGWSHRGLEPHRTHLWIDGLPMDDPLTGRPRFELLPPSFLKPPDIGIDPGGGGVGVHTSWRDYRPKHPVTEIRYRRDSNGLHAVETAHSQKRRLDLFGRPGILQITFGYGGRKANGVYDGSSLRSERRVWGRLRYQTSGWAIELSDRSSRYRIGARGSVQPPGPVFETIYALPVAATSVENPSARRRTIRNDLTARARGPLLPRLKRPTEIAASWTSNTFDFETGFGASDTTWTVKLNGGHAHLQQSLTAGLHDLTVTARGSIWNVARGNVPQLKGSREELHVLLRDSLRLGARDVVLDLGGHRASDRWVPSAALRATERIGNFQLSAAARAAGQRTSWIEEEGFANLVSPLKTTLSGPNDRLLEGTLGAGATLGPIDARLQGFVHQIRNAVDLFSDPSAGSDSPTATADTAVARSTETPLRRAGATLSFGWRQDATRGLYVTGHATLLETLNAEASLLHDRLARTLPAAYGQARVGARFVVFTDLITDLYVRGRAWSAMNSRWFHPATGRLVVPPRQNPIPAASGQRVGPSGTIDVRAEAQLRGATLFFTLENAQAGTNLQAGTFVVPVYPLPERQFRFGVFWPIFN